MVERRCRSGAHRAWLLLVVGLAAGCALAHDDEDALPVRGGAVSAATAAATAAGVRVLALGGNAVDAAVATALVLGVSEPSESGLGGHAVMLVVAPGGEATVIHAGAGAPLPASGDGPALALPSTLRVLGHAWRRYGSGAMAWEDLVEPAARVAEEGWSLGRYRHRVLVQEYPRLLSDSLTSALVLNADRSIPTEGTLVTNAALAATLNSLGEQGPDALVSGALGASLAAALGERGYPGAQAWLAAGTSAVETRPASGSYRGRTVLTTPEPYGGPVLLRALSFLEDAPPGALGHDGLVRTAWLAEALGWARSPAADAATFLAGLPPMPFPTTDTSLAAGSAGASPMTTRSERPARQRTQGAPARDTATLGRRTTHLSVVDGRGMAVALTLSLGRPYGAGFVAGDLGFFPGVAPGAESESLREVALDSGGAGGESAAESGGAADPEAGEVEDEAAREAVAGPRWWAAPTVVLREGRTQLVLGSPGGPRGVSAVVQVIAAWIAGAGTLGEVIEAPRVHVTPDSTQRHRLILEGVVWMDPARSSPRVLAPFGDSLLRPLAAERDIVLGEHDRGPFFQDWDPWFGGVHAVARADEGWVAVADPRRDGVGHVVGPADVVEATGQASAGRDGVTDSTLPAGTPSPPGP